MKTQTKRDIKIIIIALATIGLVLAALSPVFGKTDNSSQNIDKDILKAVRETAQNIIQNKNQQALKLEEKVALRAEREEEVREEINTARQTIQEIITEVSEAITNAEPKKINIESIPESFVFAHELRQRATGEEVLQLQKILNADVATIVAESGPGSSGNETIYFGPATEQALLRFQRKYGISENGIFGTQTKAKMNEILQNGLTLMEPAEEQLNQVRAKFANALKLIENIRERINQIGEEDTEEDVEEEVEEDETEEIEEENDDIDSE
jgi:murein L,D-transpeptidase YcbB/YkuD